jgi:replication-associated recombination protein RarA
VAGGKGPASAARPSEDKPERQERAAKTRDASSATAAKAASRVARGPQPSGNGGADLANALNVSIKPSSRDERLFMMRMLEPGEQPKAGYRPALVIMVDSDEDEGA